MPPRQLAGLVPRDFLGLGRTGPDHTDLLQVFGIQKADSASREPPHARVLRGGDMFPIGGPRDVPEDSGNPRCADLSPRVRVPNPHRVVKGTACGQFPRVGSACDCLDSFPMPGNLRNLTATPVIACSWALISPRRSSELESRNRTVPLFESVVRRPLLPLGEVMVGGAVWRKTLIRLRSNISQMKSALSRPARGIRVIDKYADVY